MKVQLFTRTVSRVGIKPPEDAFLKRFPLSFFLFLFYAGKRGWPGPSSRKNRRKGLKASDSSLFICGGYCGVGTSRGGMNFYLDRDRTSPPFPDGF